MCSCDEREGQLGFLGRCLAGKCHQSHQTGTLEKRPHLVLDTRNTSLKKKTVPNRFGHCLAPGMPSPACEPSSTVASTRASAICSMQRQSRHNKHAPETPPMIRHNLEHYWHQTTLARRAGLTNQAPNGVASDASTICPTEVARVCHEAKRRTKRQSLWIM